MTDKRTLSLNARQWRVLLHDNLEVLKANVASTETIREEDLRVVCAQLDDMKMLASAWFQVSHQPVQEPVAKAADVPASGNGAEPKKRGGWPKGKKRNVSAEAVQ